MKNTLFLSKIRKDVAKFVICCSRHWRFNLRVNPFKADKNFKFYQLDQSISILSVVGWSFDFQNILKQTVKTN